MDFGFEVVLGAAEVEGAAELLDSDGLGLVDEGEGEGEAVVGKGVGLAVAVPGSSVIAGPRFTDGGLDNSEDTQKAVNPNTKKAANPAAHLPHLPNPMTTSIADIDETHMRSQVLGCGQTKRPRSSRNLSRAGRCPISDQEHRERKNAEAHLTQPAFKEIGGGGGPPRNERSWPSRP